jgi:Xaa-Pro aminopeptidase
MAATVAEAIPPPDVRFRDRIERFGSALPGAGIAAAIVTAPRDLLYLTGSAQPCNLLVVPGAEPLLCARRFGERVREEVPFLEVRDDAGLDALRERLARLGLAKATIGLALDVIPAKIARRTETVLAGAAVSDYSPLLLAQRAVKEQVEIDAIEHAAQLFSAAHETVLEHARPGVREHELSGEIARSLRRAGHEGHVFYRRWDANLQPEGILTSGDNLARISGHSHTITGIGLSRGLPFGASQRELREGDLLVLDVGLNRGGYHADIARTYALGHVDERVAGIADAMVDAFETCRALARPGVRARDLYEAAVGVCAAAGLDSFFQGYGDTRGEYVGHGVGLELDEPPVLARGVESALEAGMTLAIEPKVISPDFGGVDVEDTVVVTPDGGRVLGPVERRLFVI